MGKEITLKKQFEAYVKEFTLQNKIAFLFESSNEKYIQWLEKKLNKQN